MLLVPIAQVVIRFRRLLYSTDCRSKCIERMDKATGNQRSVLRERLEGIMEIRAAAKDKQTAILARKLTADAVIGVCSAPCRFVRSGPDIPDNKPCTPSKWIHTILAWLERNCNRHDLFNSWSKQYTLGLYATRSGCGYD